MTCRTLPTYDVEMMSAPDQFLDQIETFLRVSRMSATTFGKLAASDPTFVFELREGRECRSKTQKRVLDWIRGYHPDGKGCAA